LTTHLPMGDWGSGNTRDFSVPGHIPAKDEDKQVVADFDGPDFFRTMGISLQKGRDFTTSDNENSPKVAIINTVMAQRYWPKGDAIGGTIVVDKLPRQIVGVAPEFAYHSPNNTDHDPVIFLPMLQGRSGYGYAILAIHSRTNAIGLAGQLRRAVTALDPFLPIEQIRTLDDVTGQQYQISRIPAELLGVYAICSVLVAMMGLYAVMAYSVLERNREFAVRMALGSSRGGIFRLVIHGSASVILVGLVVGGAGSIAAVRLLRSMLFNVAPFDPISFSLAAVALVMTVLLAGITPARRAAGIEPMQALRTE
jgi:hypothetical protein